ncbi:serine/threonine-protein kinase [Nannocystis pusilla]|uniref:Serine/threonine-protein kinase n=1 Tax=Nannocystis pusilla TaxID=889268 RepID=A0ABS7TTI1_9BACT|nr:serine/threonine-protein kinase [Nannocystis pusilla]MBZ5711530.1 serine/threonine-protein kinase [Nannocystis pusilla]
MSVIIPDTDASGISVDISQSLPGVTITVPATLPPRLGRFTILERLGGGTAVVYAAYDELLDRKVAIKVLPDTGSKGQIRLLREAQAMAGVTHPNVITVLEAGVVKGQVYVAMELIRGAALPAWLAAGPRTWREIHDVFTQAARGLAAAHDVGLLHRDFKPGNLMIDATGRACVLDFGLVRATPDRSLLELSSGASQSMRIRVSADEEDDILGTPAYLAPERWRGGPAEPASDQFSFCVALYEALFGLPPFAGNDILALSHAITNGELRPPPRNHGVPAWLVAAIMRGLKTEPRERYPSMEALLGALAPARGRAWRFVGAGLALAVTAGAAGLAVVPEAAAESPCTDSDAQIQRVWGPAQRNAVATALRDAAPNYAAVLWPKVADKLDRFAAAWTENHRDTCLAEHQGRYTESVIDRQRRCLDRRRAALDETVKALSIADMDMAPRALGAASDLVPPSACHDLAFLKAEPPGPDDAELGERVADLRNHMARAEALAKLGRIHDAVDEAGDVETAAEQLGYAPLRAESALLRGRLSLNTSEETGQEIEWLTRAMRTGLESRGDAIAAEAVALRLVAVSRRPELVGRALADEPLALALAARGAAPEALRGLVLHNLGVAHLAQRNPTEARRYFTEALGVRQAALATGHRDIGYTLLNLASVTEPGSARDDLLARALEIFDAELGVVHPATIEARITAAQLAEPGEAWSILQTGCVALERFLPDDLVRRTRCLFHLGRAATEIGDDDDAASVFRAAAELSEMSGARLFGPEATLLAGYRGLAGPANDNSAVDHLQATLLRMPDATWSNEEIAELRLVLGQNLLARGRPVEARSALSAAVAELTALAADDPHWAPRLARAHRTLAEAMLSASPPAVAAARPHLTAAINFYRDAGASFARQLAASERLLARGPARPKLPSRP